MLIGHWSSNESLHMRLIFLVHSLVRTLRGGGDEGGRTAAGEGGGGGRRVTLLVTVLLM